jgi:methylglyoxal synthase
MLDTMIGDKSATPARPRLALIAHDGKKRFMIAWAGHNREALSRFDLVATESTACDLHELVGLDVRAVLSGPSGGDVQIAAEIAMGLVKAVIFLIDPLASHPHDPDIAAVLRVCNVHDVPIATNVRAADLFMTSALLVPKADMVVAAGA